MTLLCARSEQTDLLYENAKDLIPHSFILIVIIIISLGRLALSRHTFSRCELLCNFNITRLTLNKVIQFKNSIQFQWKNLDKSSLLTFSFSLRQFVEWPTYVLYQYIWSFCGTIYHTVFFPVCARGGFRPWTWYIWHF